MKHATGPFDVKMTPQAPDDYADGTVLARFSLDKVFKGDLEATSKGQMLSAGSVQKGSAGYVAIERVSGQLHGRRGTFVLQHSGSMSRGTPSLVLTVVPDSGTDELEGLTGSMAIIRAEGKHAYVFDYAIDDAPAASS
jgi:hypothetical protein